MKESCFVFFCCDKTMRQ